MRLRRARGASPASAAASRAARSRGPDSPLSVNVTQTERVSSGAKEAAEDRAGSSFEEKRDSGPAPASRVPAQPTESRNETASRPRRPRPSRELGKVIATPEATTDV